MRETVTRLEAVRTGRGASLKREFHIPIKTEPVKVEPSTAVKAEPSLRR